MDYVTIYNTIRENKIIIIKNLFEEHNLNYRVLKEPTNNSVAVGARVQVEKSEVDKANKILKENGFFGIPEPEPDSELVNKFWLYLFMALIVLIIISVLVNRYFL